MPPASPAAAPPPRLRRLPGRTPTLRLSRATPSARLWIDDTQLVQETVRSYTQEVQRFAFADIQAVQIRRTPRGLVYNIVLAALLALTLFGLVKTLEARGPSFGDRVALGITAGVFATLLLVNSLRGATCRTVLTTALGPQPLPSLSRMSAARRALDAIIAGTGAIQGVLPPDEAMRYLDQAQRAHQAQSRPPATPPPPVAAPPPPAPPAPY